MLGGRRGGAKQSCTFVGSPAARDQLAEATKLAETAKLLIESRGHNITRPECYEAILGKPQQQEVIMPTFKEWSKVWIAELFATKRVQSDVCKRYERDLKFRAVPFLGHLRLDAINRDMIKAFVQWMCSNHVTYGNRNRRDGDRQVSARTIRRHFMIVSSCLAFAVPTFISVNPTKAMPGERRNYFGLPPVVPFEGMFLDSVEVQAILDACPPDLYDLVYVAVRTGMRMGELLALESRYVVFPRTGGATVLVRKSRKSDGTVGTPKTPSSRRDLPVVGRAAEILARRVKGKKPSALVFTTPRGYMWNAENLRARHWYRAVAKARRCPEHPPPTPPKPAMGRPRGWRNDEVSTCGCPGVLQRVPRFHDLRHTHASALIANGWHFKKIQRRLGHARFQTTMDVYGHLADLGGEEELGGIEDFFNPLPVNRHPRTAGPARQHVQRARARKLLVRRAAA